MNDEYIALDCASSLCGETGIEARLRKTKRSRRKGVNTNMSPYIVEDNTINRVVNNLVYEIGHNPESYSLKEKLSELGYDLSDNLFAEKLGKDMFDLNVNAVRQRYSEKEVAPKFTYSQGTPTSLIQTFKSLSCWVYQCTEGDVPESDLYKFFADTVETYLLKKIVYSLPEYDEAEWALVFVTLAEVSSFG